MSELNVVGVTFDGRADVIRGLVGEGRSRRYVQYLLVAEPQNAHDANAIAVVCTAVGEAVGYVPAAVAAERRDLVGATGRLEVGTFRGGARVYARITLPEEPVLLDNLPVEFVEAEGEGAADDSTF